MTLVPASIAGRTWLALFVGLLLVLATTILSAGFLLFDDAGPRRDQRFLSRLVTLVSIVEGMPRAERTMVTTAFTDPFVSVRWTADPPEMRRYRGREGRRLERRFSELLAPLGIETVIAGREVSADGEALQTDDRVRDMSQPLQVAISLTDGSWLLLTGKPPAQEPIWLLRILLVAAILIGGLGALAFWVSRRVIAPLGTFAAAAARFGRDVGAPALDEDGPTEIRRAAEAFNTMQERIRRFVEERMQMLAAISHDLRTPITRLQLRADYIEDAEQRRKALADLGEMKAMLDALLSFARDDAATEETTRVDLAAMLQTLCDDATDAGHVCAYSGPPHLAFECRPVAMRRALSNLIENAAAYGHEALVELSFSGTAAEVRILDRGPGIPAEKREEVFMPFFRLEPSRSRQTGGIGLGLAIARAIVRRHGGDIILGDRDGGGLAVTVVLPRPEQAPS